MIRIQIAGDDFQQPIVVVYNDQVNEVELRDAIEAVIDQTPIRDLDELFNYLSAQVPQIQPQAWQYLKAKILAHNEENGLNDFSIANGELIDYRLTEL